MKLLAVLDEIAFLSPDSEGSVVLDSGARLTSVYLGWSDQRSAFLYKIDGRDVDAEEASRELELASMEWHD